MATVRVVCLLLCSPRFRNPSLTSSFSIHNNHLHCRRPLPDSDNDRRQTHLPRPTATHPSRHDLPAELARVAPR